MDKDPSTIYSSQKDSDPCGFVFYKNFSETNVESDERLHDFLGMPTLINVGSYSKSGYDFCRIFSVVNFDLTTSDDTVTEKSIFAHNGSAINFPDEVKSLLTQIPTKIPANGDRQFNMPYYPTKNIRFKWLILENTIKSPKGIYNIVPHPNYFKEIDFSVSKKQISNTPISMSIPSDIKNSCGVSAFVESSESRFTTSITFDNLVTQYSSIHMMGMSLGLSPNNLKFKLDNNTPICNVWLVVLDNKNFMHSVYNYWIINDQKLLQKLEGALKDSNNLENVISGFTSILGNKDPNLNQLIRTLNFS